MVDIIKKIRICNKRSLNNFKNTDILSNWN